MPRQRDERRMTFVVVPHGGSGDLSTRSYEISYRRLRLALYAGGAIAVALFLMAASWFWLAAQAGRVQMLQREVAELQQERQERERLARTVARMQATYDQIRVLLKGELPPPDSIQARARAVGARAPGDSGATRDTTATDVGADSAAKDGPSAALPHAWPLADLAFVTRGPADAPDGHPGLDIAVAAGSRILAAGEGTVLEAGDDPVYGRFVVIGHGGGYQSLYGHASRLLVQPHQHVRAEQVIALSGSTGVSTAPHLHFEIRRNGQALDPRRFVSSPAAF
ncbi:MAG: peptidoglycan DD-metalloendopeptidase family protein [Longimicrobiaceae bacterium]